MNLKEQKNKLEAEKEKLVTGLAYYKKEDPYLTPEHGLSSGGEDDIADIEGHDRLAATQTALKKDLMLVEEALKRIEEGTYGTCLVCGEKIEEDRLEALPAARLCLRDEASSL